MAACRPLIATRIVVSFVSIENTKRLLFVSFYLFIYFFFVSLLLRLLVISFTNSLNISYLFFLQKRIIFIYERINVYKITITLCDN